MAIWRLQVDASLELRYQLSGHVAGLIGKYTNDMKKHLHLMLIYLFDEE